MKVCLFFLSSGKFWIFPCLEGSRFCSLFILALITISESSVFELILVQLSISAVFILFICGSERVLLRRHGEFNNVALIGFIFCKCRSTFSFLGILVGCMVYFYEMEYWILLI